MIVRIISSNGARWTPGVLPCRDTGQLIGLAGHLGTVASRPISSFLDTSNSKAISKICVRMFLPALLITQIGSELHSGSADRYLYFFVWALVCHLLSFIISVIAHLGFGMPDWVTVALMFNNTTSYPLLLYRSPGRNRHSGVADSHGRVHRAATGAPSRTSRSSRRVSSCLTFAVGPRLIDSSMRRSRVRG